MRLVRPAAILGSLLLLGATACGGKKAANPSLGKPSSASASIAAAIKTRLRAQGYAVQPQQLHLEITLGKAAGGGMVTGRKPLFPPGTPTPQDAFRIQVDFTSPHNFTLSVFVFGSAARAALTERKTAAVYTAECKQVARAVRAHPSAAGTRVPCQTFDIRRVQVIGPVFYSAYTDDNGMSRLDFNKIVALASGHSPSR